MDAEELGDDPLPFIKSEDVVEVLRAFDRVDMVAPVVFANVVSSSLLCDVLEMLVEGSLLGKEIPTASLVLSVLWILLAVMLPWSCLSLVYRLLSYIVLLGSLWLLVV